jgi:hypothetical protein
MHDACGSRIFEHARDLEPADTELLRDLALGEPIEEVAPGDYRRSLQLGRPRRALLSGDARFLADMPVRRPDCGSLGIDSDTT